VQYLDLLFQRGFFVEYGDRDVESHRLGKLRDKPSGAAKKNQF
jgi:hypothetical protein